MTNTKEEKKRAAPTTSPNTGDAKAAASGPPTAKKSRTLTLLDALFDKKFELEQRIPQSTFQDLQGMDEIQKKLKGSIIRPFANPEKAAKLKIEIPRGLLLTGQPGTGKTALADAIVNDIRATGKTVCYYQETSSILTKEFGGSEKNVRELFKLAKDNAPSVIFLDELDGLGKSRDSEIHCAKHTILTTLLTEINNIVPGEVLLIAATNCPTLCDKALLRKGRFDLTIDLPLPPPQAREDITRHYFTKKGITVKPEALAEIVDRTGASTGSDLKCLVDRIYDNIVNRVFPEGSWLEMSDQEMIEKAKSLQDIDMANDVRPELAELEEANGTKGKDLSLYT